MNLLCIGVAQPCIEVIQRILPTATLMQIPDAKAFEGLFESPPATPFELIFCGDAIAELKSTELAQGTRGQFQKTTIFFLTQKREGFDKKDFVKNGFDDAFLLPMDDGFLKTLLEDVAAKSAQIKANRPVKLIDIQPDSVLSFNVKVFLPQNKKFVHFSNAGDPIDKTRVERLQSKQVNTVYVPIEEMGKFYEYSAERLIALGKADNNSMSETERRDRLQKSVRDLFGTVVNTAADQSTVDQGKALLESTKQIVDKFIVLSAPADWFQNIKKGLADNTDTYSHSTAVSTFAALFSIGLGMGKPEELAIAGMFHDLGKADVLPSVLEKAPDSWTAEEKKMYESHPEYTVNIMKARKMIVPPSVTTAILQHHERWDGIGYPKGLHGVKISPEANVLRLADEFDYLTRVEAGKKAHTPYEAVCALRDSGAFEPEFIQKVLKIVPKD